MAREDATTPAGAQNGRRRRTCRQGFMGWLVCAAGVGYLVAGPAGALVAGMMFLPAVFGVRGK